MASPVTKWHDVPFGCNIVHLIHSTNLKRVVNDELRLCQLVLCYDCVLYSQVLYTGWVSTCHGVATLVRQCVDGSEEFTPFHVLVEVKLCLGISAVLDHAHPGLVLPNLKGTRHGGDEVTDVFKVSSSAP